MTAVMQQKQERCRDGTGYGDRPRDVEDICQADESGDDNRDEDGQER